MKKVMWTLVTVVGLAVGLGVPTCADVDDDGGSLVGDWTLLERGQTFQTYRDMDQRAVLILLEDEIRVRVSFDPSNPALCVRHEERLYVWEPDTDQPMVGQLLYRNAEEADDDDEENAERAEAFCEDLRAAFLQVIEQEPRFPATLRVLGTLLLRIFPDDPELFQAWWTQVQQHPAQEYDPCAFPCVPELCPAGCPGEPPPPPDPPPTPPEPDPGIDIITCFDFCDTKLDPQKCLDRSCKGNFFKGSSELLACVKICETKHGECILECLDKPFPGAPGQGGLGPIQQQ